MTPEPMTLQEEFDHFITAVYPDPPKELDPATAHAYRDMRSAFFAGRA